MKKLIVLTLLLLAGLVFLQSCHKENFPSKYGYWETLTTVGFRYNYHIEQDGIFCRSLPDEFPGTLFCYSYRENRDTMFIDAPAPETWVWRFDDETTNIAYVTAYTPNDTYQYLLKRKGQ